MCQRQQRSQRRCLRLRHVHNPRSPREHSRPPRRSDRPYTRRCRRSFHTRCTRSSPRRWRRFPRRSPRTRSQPTPTPFQRGREGTDSNPASRTAPQRRADTRLRRTTPNLQRRARTRSVPPSGPRCPACRWCSSSMPRCSSRSRTRTACSSNSVQLRRRCRPDSSRRWPNRLLTRFRVHTRCTLRSRLLQSRRSLCRQRKEDTTSLKSRRASRCSDREGIRCTWQLRRRRWPS